MCGIWSRHSIATNLLGVEFNAKQKCLECFDASSTLFSVLKYQRQEHDEGHDKISNKFHSNSEAEKKINGNVQLIIFMYVF